ncbi:serine hydrolase [Vagococcus salmoninarum]|uniref:Beta-lactamase class A catalytic domain-containing protein n=1 Tax=Vagococcus salmoninarum TaxID=2739 RepID=A0A429ZMN4_9ENTE|nr:serine hydrolase [Vagococcus salmoninarum]RST94967.1 hypothetical protein CBF35_08845 [Vagococcus salmoninarum]
MKKWQLLLVSLGTLFSLGTSVEAEEASSNATVATTYSEAIISNSEAESESENKTETEEPLETTESLREESTNSPLESTEESSLNSESEALTSFSTKIISEKQYVTIRYPDSKLFQEVNGDVLGTTKELVGLTFLTKELVENETGEEYYGIYNKQDLFLGYIKGTDVFVSNSPGGQGVAFNKYATVVAKGVTAQQDFLNENAPKVPILNNRTYFAKEQFNHVDGETYLSLFDKSEKLQGYVNLKTVKIAAGPQGAYQEFNQYVTVLNKKDSLLNDFDGGAKQSSSNLYGQTFLAKGMYSHFDGTTYYSLFNHKKQWQGYLNSKSGKLGAGPQGMYQGLNKYATIVDPKALITKDFNGSIQQPTNNVLGKTYLVKRFYNHFNGQAFYSLYDSQSKWQGYVNSRSVKMANGPQGSYQGLNKYVTITSNKETLWANFNGKKRGETSKLVNKTFLAKGVYGHYNGIKYYSTYDSKGKWLGYLNAKSAKETNGPQGSYRSFNKQVVVTSKNYNLWSNFNWKKKQSSSKLYNQSYLAKGIYNHYNGSSYYSVYDSKNRWQGYLNTKATKLTTSDAQKMKKVQALLNKKYKSSNYGIHVLSLTDGSTASINGNQRFTAASTGKLPALYYTQKMINAKKLNPNKKYQYNDRINQMTNYSYMRGGAGILQGKPMGSYYSLDQIMNWTAKYSDNQGANFLGYYGANKFSPTMRKDISGIIGRTWTSPFSITAKENALLMAAIYQEGGQVVGYLQNTVYDDQRIPKYLPVKVAHKIGDVGSYRHDVAIVYNKQPYVLSVLTQNYVSYETISKMSKSIYDIMK